MVPDNTAAVGEWDLIQMAFAVITCSAPIYKSLLPKTSLLSSAKLRYAMLAYGLRHGSGSGSRKTTNESATNISSSREGDWIHLVGASEPRGFVTTQVNSEPFQSKHDGMKAERPLRTVHIQQSVETV